MSDSLQKLLLLLLLVFTISCKQEGETDEAPKSLTPDELQEYMDRFIGEAENLNQSYDLTDLDIRFVDEPIFGRFCGYGYTNYNNTGRRRIEITNTPGCWTDLADIEKETLFFHEVGHALLNRLHLETELPNGLPRTIMCGECDIFGLINKFQTYKRDYYIEELIFGQSVASPDWARARTSFQEFYNESLIDDNNWGFETTDVQMTSSINTGDNDYPNGGLVMGSKNEFTDDFGFWGLDIENPSIEEGATLQLKVRLSSLQNIEGNGISIAIRTDNIEGNTSERIHFVSTQGNTTLTGQFQRTVTLTLPGYSAESDLMRIFVLFLAGTKGEVIIEDVEISTAD